MLEKVVCIDTPVFQQIEYKFKAQIEYKFKANQISEQSYSAVQLHVHVERSKSTLLQLYASTKWEKDNSTISLKSGNLEKKKYHYAQNAVRRFSHR